MIRSSFALILLTAAVTGLAAVVASTAGWAAPSVILALGVLAIAVIPLAARIRARRFDLLEPVVGGVLTLAVLFGVRPIAMVIDGDFVYRGVDITPVFPFVVGLGLLAIAAFAAIYEAVARRLARQVEGSGEPPETLNRSAAYGYIVVLAVVSVLAFGVHLIILGGGNFIEGFRLAVSGTTPEKLDAWGGTTEYLSVSPVLSASAAILLGIVTRWRPTKLQLIAIVLLVAYPALVFLMAGERRYILPCIGIPVVAWLLMTNRRPGWRTLLVVGTIGLYALAVLPFARSGGLDGTRDRTQAFIDNLAKPAVALERFVLGPDTSMVSALSREVQTLDEPGDFFYGRATVGDLLLAPVPHVLVPAKPQTARDEMLARTFGGPCNVGLGGVCDDFSIVGTFYQDFWIVGVGVLMGVAGAWSALIWTRWRRWPYRPALIILLAAWVVFVPIMFRAGFMPAMAWLLYFVVPCLVGVFVSSIQLRRPVQSRRSSGKL